MKIFRKIIADESGQGLVEYSLILSLLVLAVVGGVIIFGESVYDLYEIVKEKVTNAL